MISDLLEENADLRKQVEELENELTAEKEYNATLRKEIDEYTNSHTLCTKYKDLEKENAELKKTVTEKNTLIERLNRRISTQCGSNRVTNEKLKARLEQVERQKQEIAELKEKLKPENCLKLLAKDGYVKFTSDKFTEAKAIINEFIKWADWQGNSKCPSFKRIQDKAEQFLKEVKGDNN